MYVKGVFFYVCVHVNNPSLTVPHVVSLTVPTKTAPVGSNPFEDDEDEEEEEEEMAVEQQTTVNHNSVKKEEIKTLVNRRKKTPPPHPQPPPPFSVSIFVSRIAVLAISCSWLLTLLPSTFIETLSPPSGGRLLCCSAWSVELHCTQSQCVSVFRS